MYSELSSAELPIYSNLESYISGIEKVPVLRKEGRVMQVIGHMVEATNPGCSVGGMCQIYNPATKSSVTAEVVGFRKDRMLVMPLHNAHGIGPKCRVVPEDRQAMVPVGEGLLGRVIDPLMRPMDGLGELPTSAEVPLYPEVVNPLNRKRIKQPLDVGVRSINACLTCGRGQRIGIMAGSGVGKSVLLGMMARYTDADINVISLVGERGKEVREFIEDNLGEEGMRRSVVVVATSDQPPLLRMRGAYVATSIAEYFRSQAKDVLLSMDSLTRFAMAQREIGLAAGEPPTTKGYPPSVFALLPNLLERAGTHEGPGSITGFYTVLVEGDDASDPIADAIRAIVDGHIYLSREIAEKGTFPAVDLLSSTSRVMVNVVGESHLKLNQILRRTLATYREAEDLINIGAYVQGSNSEIDYAITKYPLIQEFIQQGMNEHTALKECEDRLQQIFGDRMEGNKVAEDVT
ncbi:MAG: FliI/YscN family ATPase [SAR324 cluster bacterium]|jgi:flagellum-specific ATP synthase|nr:FliI/YscN family ATPase [SAR324 cluster bacterium]MCH2266585.1 FliI/YscN family ATPase [SAR324 cluster bacterium]